MAFPSSLLRKFQVCYCWLTAVIHRVHTTHLSSTRNGVQLVLDFRMHGVNSILLYPSSLLTTFVGRNLVFSLPGLAVAAVSEGCSSMGATPVWHVGVLVLDVTTTPRSRRRCLSRPPPSLSGFPFHSFRHAFDFDAASYALRAHLKSEGVDFSSDGTSPSVNRCGRIIFRRY